jgi:hypothetical protein
MCGPAAALTVVTRCHHSAAQGLFRDIPEADFRLDISSTQLRAAAAEAASY